MNIVVILKDYYRLNGGTKDETIGFDESPYEEGICEYFHQKNKALTASHSVINYSMMLSLLRQFSVRELSSDVRSHQSKTRRKKGYLDNS